jgi:hypothetical protein
MNKMKELKYKGKVLKPFDVILETWIPQDNRFLKIIATLQRHFDKGKFNHAILYLGTGKAVHSSWNGVEIFDLDPNYQNFSVFRPTVTIKEEQLKPVYSYLVDLKLNGNDKYSFLGLLGAGIGALYGYFTGKKKLVIKEEGKPFCSELVMEAFERAYPQFYRACLIDMSLKYDELVTPNDIARCKYFKEL